MGKTSKPPLVQVAPIQRSTVCLTVRDVYGEPLGNLKLTMSQLGRVLKSTNGQPLKTDDKGRVDVADVDSEGALALVLDENYAVDPAPLHPANAKYIYKVRDIPQPSLFLVQDGGSSNAHQAIDSSKAYLTVFADLDPYRLKYRFPWQNPVHRESLAPTLPIYRRRDLALRAALKLLFQAKDADGADHDTMLRMLFQRYQSGVLPVGSRADQPAPPPPDEGPVHDIVPPAPDTEPTLPEAEAPTEVVPTSPPRDARSIANLRTPASEPPILASEVDDTGPLLPLWVWYLIFHYSGLRYLRDPLVFRTGHEFVA